MPEYIEREKTVELFRSLGSRDYRREKGTIQDAIKMLSSPVYTPAADVAPVVHGRWIKINNPTYSPFDYSPPYLYLCDQCHKKEQSEKRFCPSCGALMDLEDPQP